MTGLKRQSKKVSILIIFALLFISFPGIAKAEITETNVKVEFESLPLGDWDLYNDSTYSGGAGIRGLAGETYTFTFTGVNIRIPIKLIYNSSTTEKATIKIDGKVVFSIGYTSNYTGTLYVDDLPNQEHTVEVYVPKAGLTIRLDYFEYNITPKNINITSLYPANGKINVLWDNNNGDKNASRYDIYINNVLVGSADWTVNKFSYQVKEFGNYDVKVVGHTAVSEVYSEKSIYYYIPDPPYRFDFEDLLEYGWSVVNGAYIKPINYDYPYEVDFKGNNIKIYFSAVWSSGGNKIDFWVDGVNKYSVSFYSPSNFKDQVVYINGLPDGIHTLKIQAGTINLDYFEVLAPPGIPVITNAKASYDRIDVSWNNVNGAISYNFYVNDIKVASDLKVTSFTYYVNSPGNYKINIEAVNDAGATKSSDFYLNVVMLPAKPTVNYSIYRGKITLNLSSYGAISYKIFVNGQEVGQTTSNTFEYQLPQNGSYTVSVTAMNLYGETVGDPINLGYVYVPPEKPNLLYEFVNGVLRLYWNKALNALDYLVKQDTQQIAVTDKTYYEINIGQILNSSLYTFKLTARNPAFSTEGDPYQVLLLAKPKNATGRYIDTDKKIEVTWDTDPYAEGYYIERSEDGQIFRTVAQTSQNSYIDTDVKANRKYYYRVKSFNTAY